MTEKTKIRLRPGPKPGYTPIAANNKRRKHSVAMKSYHVRLLEETVLKAEVKSGLKLPSLLQKLVSDYLD